MPTLDDAVVLITGANGGLGTHFVHQALERGARKVYAAARTTRRWEASCVIPLLLDVTDGGSIAKAARVAADVTVLVNNAGISNKSSVLDDLTAARELFETNFWGALEVTNAFLPALRAHEGTVLNVLSVMSWIGLGDAYSASKAALWSATNTQRIKLASEGVHVTSLHLGYADTPMVRSVTAPKLDPADVVRNAYDGVEAGDFEILADDRSVKVKAALAGPIEEMNPELKAAKRKSTD
jgi:NAD(P)-dependent dehydrogenase (short-subunit alcohol dehydrogenase family)